jgi:hypothetical protein
VVVVVVVVVVVEVGPVARRRGVMTMLLAGRRLALAGARQKSLILDKGEEGEREEG